MFYIVYFFVCFVAQVNTDFLASTTIRIEKQSSGIIPMYWINTNYSTERRHYMNTHLNEFHFLHTRIQAGTPFDLELPNDIITPEKCVFESMTKSDQHSIRKNKEVSMVYPN